MLTIKTNLDELLEKFKKAAEESQNIDYGEALLVGVNAGMGLMKNRIFNQGQDKFGVSLGKYVGKKTGVKAGNKIRKLRIAKELNFDDGLTDYEKERLRDGRQIGYKDLELTGDLRRGVVIGQESNVRVICWIPNDFLFTIAKYQEEQIASIRGDADPAQIFALSDDEKKAVEENTKEAIKQIYDRIFNNS